MSQHSPARRRRAVVTVGLLAVLAAGCAIQPDAAPRDVPDEDRGLFGPETATGGVTAGSSLIYLSAPNEPGTPQLLRSAMREVPRTAAAVLRSLQAGPNLAEREAGNDTAIPTTLQVHSVSTPSNVSTIDINDALDELDALDLRYAVAQIVFTVAALDSVDAVQIRVDGQVRAWPRGDGELTSEPLTPYDFPGFVESTQPAYPAVPSGG